MAEDTRKGLAGKYEEVLKKVRDVITARVVLAGDDGITEIHVLASSARAVKYVVRDIESSLIAAFGVVVDRRKISVAQIGDGESAKNTNRIQLRRVEIVSQSDLAEVHVCLKVGPKEVKGSDVAQPTQRAWLRAAARATIDALEQFLTPDVWFDLQDVCVMMSKTLRVALVTIVLNAFGHQQILTGSCPVSYDEREAVVKATLDAVNRRFAQLLERDQ
jgi:hypothetical protein